jgi:PBP1b-binding outer membrane lipoprotein LpoB
MDMKHLYLAGVLGSAVVLGGCVSDRGNSGGRIDVSATTEAELDSAKVLPASLIEFSDQASRRIVQDLVKLPRIRDNAGRVTVILGDINNRTGIVSSTEFEVLTARLRNNLINSETARGTLRFVERRARMQDLAAREGVASDQVLADPPDYDPATTYALNADVYRISRGETHQYYMEVQLVHFASNEIVFSDRYDDKHSTDD